VKAFFLSSRPGHKCRRLLRRCFRSPSPLGSAQSLSPLPEVIALVLVLKNFCGLLLSLYAFPEPFPPSFFFLPKEFLSHPSLHPNFEYSFSPPSAPLEPGISSLFLTTLAPTYGPSHEYGLVGVFFLRKSRSFFPRLSDTFILSVRYLPSLAATTSSLRPFFPPTFKDTPDVVFPFFFISRRCLPAVFLPSLWVINTSTRTSCLPAFPAPPRDAF